MKAYSLDLREKVLLAYQNNDLSEREIARLFGVSLSFVRDLLKLYRETGHVDPKPHAGGTPRSIDGAHLLILRKCVDRRPDATLEELREDYRTLTNQTPDALTKVDNLFTDNSDTMVTLLGSLATTSQLLYLRVPALQALFPTYRTSVLDAIGSTMHDQGLWATGDIYPRYSCDYGTPRRPPSSADYPEPYMYTYCRDEDPAVLIRGAKNAPRPAGDDTAGPPQGADLGKTTDPTPKGRYTIPTPYGGPTLPIEPPH